MQGQSELDVSQISDPPLNPSQNNEHLNEPKRDSVVVKPSSNCKPSESAAKRHKLRDFWSNLLGPSLAYDRRTTKFLRLFANYDFSWERFASLPLIFQELGLPTQLLDEFHEAIQQSFVRSPELFKTFPKYIQKFQSICSQKTHWKTEKSKNFDKCKEKVRSVFVESDGHPKEAKIKKKVKREDSISPQSQIMVSQEVQTSQFLEEKILIELNIEKKDTLIVKLVYTEVI